MSKISIMDASALLAYMQEERGQELVEAALDSSSSLITAVNACEVLSKLCEKGVPADDAVSTLDSLGLSTVDFDQELALRAARLRVVTKPIGASLGDRACLALAQSLAQDKAAVTIYTAERAWSTLKWPFKIVVIR